MRALLDGRERSRGQLSSSSKPCPMCEAAAYWAGIERLAFGQDIRGR
jgi:tRNA(Arg) A34 adenosine deaminase TadA